MAPTELLERQARADIKDLREGLATLVECLSVRGILRSEQFLAELHRRRFEATRRKHACALDTTLAQTLSQGVVETVRQYAGLLAFLQLRAASHTYASSTPSPARLRETAPTAVYICGGDSNGQYLGSVERLDPRCGTWELLPPMRSGRRAAAAAALRGVLYVCGGNDGLQALSSVERFAATEGHWLPPATPMRHRREGAAVTVAGGLLYALGGGDGVEVLRSVESFNPEAEDMGSWRFEQPLLSGPRMYSGAATLDGQVYVCGGTHDAGDRSLASLERLSVAGGTWEALPSMAQRRRCFAAVSLEGSLYVCGGCDHPQDVLNAMERFNPTTSAWEVLTPMPQCRLGVVATAADGRFIVCGGTFGRQDLRMCMAFDPRAGTWDPLPPMVMPRQFSASTAVRV